VSIAALRLRTLVAAFRAVFTDGVNAGCLAQLALITYRRFVAWECVTTAVVADHEFAVVPVFAVASSCVWLSNMVS
jgi:hypothetical protein